LGVLAPANIAQGAGIPARYPDRVSPIPQRRRVLRATSACGSAVLGRIEHEDRLWRGMKDRFAFLVTERGWTDFLYRGATYQQGPGLVQLKQPGEIYRDLRRDGPSTFDVVLLELDAIRAARDAIAPGAEVVFDRPQLAADDPRARPLLGLHAALLGGDGALADDTAVAEAALAVVLLGAGAHASGRERPAVRRARAYLLERLAEAVRLDDLADHVGVDKYHLIRAFRAEVGVPPYEFLTHARIHRARELLHRGLSATEVASAVGYCDQSQLHRHFVRLTGTTPGRYATARRRSLRASTTAAS